MPELVVELNGQTWTLDPSRAYNLGRDPQADVAFDDARVSWRHAIVRWGQRGWVVEDLGSTNGTYAQGQRVQRFDLGAGAVVHLGNAADGPRLTFAAGQPFTTDVYGPETSFIRPAAAGVAPQMPNQVLGRQAPVGQDPPYGAWPRDQTAPQPVVSSAGPTGTPPVYGGDRGPTTFHQLAVGGMMKIGRALENDLVVPDLQVSRFHAEFRALADGRYEIADLGSHNGTYVNGQPIRRHMLAPSDVVGVGRSTFQLVGDRLEELVDTGEVTFSARRLTVTVPQGQGDRTILNDVSFTLPWKSLIAVIGPSGSGKSTLLRALTGYRPADEGEVLYDNRNLYTHFAELRQRIGLVPQDDILHKELTIRTALKYAAKLRFPGDTKAAEREARIDEVLRELKLDIHSDKRVTSLSGGQRKRVSVALELLTKPSLIFLDEPTSGLDPGMDRDVMKLLRRLADDGRTVVVATHSVAELALCDELLVMAPGGSVAYFGPPAEALNFFDYDSWADVFSAFENYRDYDWSGRWQGSQHYESYAADLDAAVPQQVQPAPRLSRAQKPQRWSAQLWTLVSRYLTVIASDRGFIGLMLVLPAVLGAVSTIIPADSGLGIGPAKNSFQNRDAGTILLILCIGACFSGSANSVRELIKERVIYERERATGLSRSAYLMSKVIVLGVITALQGVVISVIGFAPREVPKEGVIIPHQPAVEMALVIMALGFTSMMVGLIISSLVKTAEKTMPLLVMFAMVQVVFTGVLFQIFDKPGIDEVAWLMPSRWALAAVGTTANLNVLMPWKGAGPDPLWKHTAAQWMIDTGILVGIGVICGLIVQRLLRRHEPEVMRK